MKLARLAAKVLWIVCVAALSSRAFPDASAKAAHAGLAGVPQAVLASPSAAPRQSLKPYEKLLPDFSPVLTPVKIQHTAGQSVITREGKGWLEQTRDGRRILHLKGTPYEMGYQHGRLLAKEVKLVMQTILPTIAVAETMRTGEPFFKRLSAIEDKCQPYIPHEYLEEARGLAAGAGLTQQTILLSNIFPELFHCSGFALWGKATADGKLYHGRILDYMNEIGLQSVAVVIVYQPNGKIPWVNISYAGFLGSVTGMNAKQVAIGEMGGKGQGQWNGMPMSYLVRKTLETAGTLDQALKVFQDTPRTCEYYYVVSDAKIPSARGLAATPEKLEIIGPGEANPRLPHPLQDAVLLSREDRYRRLVMRTQANYGRIQAPEALAIMRRPVAMQSCLHAALFCPTDGRFWVANSSLDRHPASEQPYAEYNLKDLLK